MSCNIHIPPLVEPAGIPVVQGDNLTLRDVMLVDGSMQVVGAGTPLYGKSTLPLLDDTKVMFYRRKEKFPYSSYFPEQQLPSIEAVSDKRQQLKDMTAAGHQTVKLPLALNRMQFNDCIYSQGNLSDWQIPILVENQHCHEKLDQPVGKTAINSDTQKAAASSIPPSKFNIDKVIGPLGSQKLIRKRVLFHSQQQIMDKHKSSDTLNWQQSISLSSLPNARTLSMIRGQLEDYASLPVKENNMYKQRSSSNEILNCRTIDDALFERWFRSLTPTSEEDKIDEDKDGFISPTQETNFNTNRVPVIPAIPGRATTSGFSHYVDKGFNTALTVENINVPSKAQLRQRAFYKSDYAPKVLLKKSDESQSFQKRNANLRHKIKSLTPNPNRLTMATSIK